jgi:hypothetical protein
MLDILEVVEVYKETHRDPGLCLLSTVSVAGHGIGKWVRTFRLELDHVIVQNHFSSQRGSTYISGLQPAYGAIIPEPSNVPQWE